MTQAIFSAEPKTQTSGQCFPPKVFAKPFRLAFKREDGETIWTEVHSLDGLQSVFEKLKEGELTELDRSSSMEMQLWGHLAEHTGFLRNQGSASMLAAGIQPVGSGIAPLTEDLSELLGGDDVHALKLLSDMKSALKTRAEDMAPMDCPEVTNEFVKSDGVNLTEHGENALHHLVFGAPNDFPDRNPNASTEATEFRKTAENAIEIFTHHTPSPTPEEVQAEAKEAIDCAIRGEDGGCEKNAQPSTGPIVIGADAVKIGRLVAETGRGLDNEADEETRDMSEAGVAIFKSMVKQKPNPRLLPPGSPTVDPLAAVALEELRVKLREVFPELRNIPDHQLTAKRILSELDKAADRIPGLEAFHTTFEEMKRLAGIKPVESRIGPTEVASRDNIDKILKTVDLDALVRQSDLPTMTPHEQAAHQEIKADRKKCDRTYYEEGISREEAVARGLKSVNEPGQTYGGDHYNSREVTPTSEVPTDQDERAKWLAEQQRGPASMDTYREDETRLAAGPYNMDEMRRLSGLDKTEDPKSNDGDEAGE